MPAFQSKKYRSSASAKTLGAHYRIALSKHPFLLFGLPFVATMVAGSFFLTPATALRYEKNDRRVQQMNKDEELGIGKDRRKVDMNEEYYVSLGYRPLLEYMRELESGLADGRATTRSD
jgi:cytochrome c oxidase assembly protein subunit 16